MLAADCLIDVLNDVPEHLDPKGMLAYEKEMKTKDPGGKYCGFHRQLVLVPHDTCECRALSNMTPSKFEELKTRAKERASRRPGNPQSNPRYVKTPNQPPPRPFRDTVAQAEAEGDDSDGSNYSSGNYSSEY